MRQSRLTLGLVFVLASSIAALAAAPVTVDQVRRAFSLREIHITRGNTVRFSNLDEFLHQIYISSPTFNFSSAEQSPGQVVTVEFPTKGTFDVRCEIHPKMLLNVVVD